MLACTIHGKEDLRLSEAPDPSPGQGEVLVRLAAGGICGSDLHYYFEGRNGSFVIREPLVPGHEASGIVAAIGAGVTRVRTGDRVALSPSHACGACEYCRQGREHLCERMHFLGSASVFPHAQGMFRERFVLGERQCYPVRGEITMGEIAFAEPLAVGLHAVRRAGELTAKSVLVTGAGTIGCLTVIAARHAGARTITVFDVLEEPLARAREVGADATRISAASAAPEFDVAFEVSGHPAAFATCIASVKRGGIVVQVGTLPDAPLPFVANTIMAKELDLRGAFRWGIEFEWAVDLLSARRVDVRPLLTGQYPLHDAVAAFHAAADKRKSTKVQVVAA